MDLKEVKEIVDFCEKISREQGELACSILCTELKAVEKKPVAEKKPEPVVKSKAKRRPKRKKKAVKPVAVEEKAEPVQEKAEEKPAAEAETVSQ